jgi:hypothetical protein
MVPSVRAIELIAVLVAGACSPQPTGSLEPIVYALPTTPPSYQADPICAGVDVEPLVLEGRLTDGVAVVKANGTIPIRWPPGYGAVFTPSLAIRAPDGAILATEGDDMTANPWHGTRVCVLGAPNGLPGQLEVWISPA